MRAACLFGVALSLAGCAKAIEGTGGEGGATSGGGGSASGGGGAGGDTSSVTSTTASSSAATSSSTSTGAGGADCGPMTHVCDTSCVGNTPETGCFGSTTC